MSFLFAKADWIGHMLFEVLDCKDSYNQEKHIKTNANYWNDRCDFRKSNEGDTTQSKYVEA